MLPAVDFEVLPATGEEICFGCGKKIEDVRFVSVIIRGEKHQDFDESCLEAFAWSLTYFVTHYKLDQEVAPGVN